MLKSFRTTLVLIILISASLPVFLFSLLLVSKIYTITRAAAFKEIRLTAESVSDSLRHETDLIIARLLSLGTSRDMALATRKSVLGVRHYLSGQAFDYIRKFISDNPLVSSLYLIDRELEVVLAAPSSVMTVFPSPVMNNIKNLFSDNPDSVIPEYAVADFKDGNFLSRTLQSPSGKDNKNKSPECPYGIAILVPVVFDVTNDVKGVLIAVIPFEKLAVSGTSKIENPTALEFFKDKSLIFSSGDKSIATRQDTISGQVLFQLRNPENGKHIRYGIRILEPSAVRFAEASRTAKFLTFYIIMALILLIAFAYAFARRLTAPLDGLINIVNSYAVGNYEFNPHGIKFLEFQKVVAVLDKMGKKILSQIFELRRAEEKYRSIFENAIEGIYQSTPDGRFISANPAMARIAGYDSLEEFVSSVVNFAEHTYVSPDDYKSFCRALDEKGQVVGFETRVYRKDGTLMWISESVRSVRDIHGNVLYYEGSVIDVTERKEKERAEKDRKAAEAANHAKSEFLASMSHEIRTPMNVIFGFAELLKNEIRDEQQRQYLAAITSSGETLLSIINDILDLSKIEAGKFALQYSAVNTRLILKDIQKIFSMKVRDKGLYFHTEADQSLPEGLLLDEVRLRQILFNLVGNAVKFTDTGYIRLVVHSRCTDADHSQAELTFSVQDTGAGITEDQKELIFDSFIQQAGQSAVRYGGTGLGLTITKRLVEMMGGEISVESQTGKGSTFYVTLRDVSITSPAELPETYADIDINTIKFKNALILVADDIEINRNLLKSFLEHSDIDIIEAENGREAIDVAKLYMPDMILMDMKMPVTDGYEATRVLKSDDALKSVPVIAITASAMKEDEDRIKNAGCDGYLRKPVIRTELFIEMMRFLSYSSKDSCESDTDSKKTNYAELLTPETKAHIPALLNLLENEITDKWEHVKTTFYFNEIENFANEVMCLGEAYHIDMLADWGNDLLKLAESFDMERLPGALDYFSELVKGIKELNSKK